MPLRAYLNEEEIISIDQDEKQWDHLKKLIKNKEAILRLPCCSQEGFLRTSSKGLRHFVHVNSNKTCDWKPESPEHLKAKFEIIEACKENGWKAIPEYSEINWRADVLAVKNEKRIAFEVQWSRQTYEETIFRQERYKESNVRACWFFRKAPKELREFNQEQLKADNDIPAFTIFKDDKSNIIAQLNQEKIPLKTLVSNLLSRKIKYCNQIRLKPKQKVAIVFFETSCWKCHKPQHLWTVDRNLDTVCNQNFNVLGTLWDDDNLDKDPKIYDHVIQFLKTENGKNLKIGHLKKRDSITLNASYVSHGCFYCDAIFGDFFLSSIKNEGLYSPSNIVHIVDLELNTKTEQRKHWCYSENGHFCE